MNLKHVVGTLYITAMYVEPEWELIGNPSSPPLVKTEKEVVNWCVFYECFMVF